MIDIMIRGENNIEKAKKIFREQYRRKATDHEALLLIIDHFEEYGIK